MSHWTDAGFGTDPEGDARRRAELESNGARLDPETLNRLRVSRLDELPPIPLGAALPDGRTVDDLRGAIERTIHLVPPSAEEVEVVLGPEVVEQLAEDPHAITRKPYEWGDAWTCACGRWEAVTTGPSSARWAGADYARHRSDEEAGARGE